MTIFKILTKDYDITFHSVINTTKDWTMDISAFYFGRCYTLQYPDKVGSHLDSNMMMLFLNPNLTFDIFIHDPKYFITSLSPAVFPHIRYFLNSSIKIVGN